jgi:hypothetical protein
LHEPGEQTLRERLGAVRELEQIPLFTMPSARMLRDFARHREQFPQVYGQLVELALEARARGWKRMGIAALFEVLRWQRGPKLKDDEGFALNNTLRSMYARAIMLEPGLEGFFEVRKMRAL